MPEVYGSDSFGRTLNFDIHFQLLKLEGGYIDDSTHFGFGE